jgi:hypothetical protein
MKNNVEDILAVELKREIAERYFGFRKMIEEDTLDLTKKIKYQLSILEKRISYELIRIYILLMDETLIHDFIELTGWDEKLFYDPYITESPRETIKEEIKLFYRENDIGNIMGFIRAMEGAGNEGSMGVKPDAGAVDAFEHKMRIETPPPIDPELITIPPLVPLPNISKELKKLADKAYKLHRGKILTEIAK